MCRRRGVFTAPDFDWACAVKARVDAQAFQSELVHRHNQRRAEHSSSFLLENSFDVVYCGVKLANAVFGFEAGNFYWIGNQNRLKRFTVPILKFHSTRYFSFSASAS